MKTTTARYHITQMTPDAAMAYNRRIYNCRPDVRLGWTPYNFYGLIGGHTSEFACYTEDELAAQLARRGHALDGWSEWNNGIRMSWTHAI